MASYIGVIIGSDNGLSSVLHQVITWIIDGVIPTEYPGTSFNEMLNIYLWKVYLTSRHFVQVSGVFEDMEKLI